MTHPDMPLMDAVHGWCFQPSVAGWRLGPEARRVQARYRSLLRGAERFVLDDDAVRLVCGLSHEKDRLAGWSFLARLPYDTMWIEYSLHAKVREWDRMGSLRLPFNPDEVSPAIGLLLHRDRPEDGRSARWTCSEFTVVDGKPTPGLLTYVFDPEGLPEDPVRGSRFWGAPTLSLRRPPVRIPVVVKGRELITDRGDRIIGQDRDVYCDAEHLIAGDMKESDDPDDPVTAEDWALNRIGVVASPFWEAHGPASLNFDDLLRRETRELVGDLRWIVTLLASISSLPREMKVAQTLQGRRTVGANVLPYFQHRTISIGVPRDDRIAWARQHMDRTLRNMPRPWHQVMGHWRIVEKGRLPDRPVGHAWCRHIPAMVENGLGICERCEMLVRWIPQHHRGDPNVGVVDHTYAVRRR